MAMPKFNKPEGMLGSIKSKLGFSDGTSGYDSGYGSGYGASSSSTYDYDASGSGSTYGTDDLSGGGSSAYNGVSSSPDSTY